MGDSIAGLAHNGSGRYSSVRRQKERPKNGAVSIEPVSGRAAWMKLADDKYSSSSSRYLDSWPQHHIVITLRYIYIPVCRFCFFSSLVP
jgi:hypothetical protein